MLFRRIVAASVVRLGYIIDWIANPAAKTKLGAWILDRLFPSAKPLLCASCFTDQGLRLDASEIGYVHALACPNCGAVESKKLNRYSLLHLASRFFVRGSVSRSHYGCAPLIQFNERRETDYEAPAWLKRDVALISEKARIGLFDYGPRLWMIGEVEPLKALQDPDHRGPIIHRILKEYPTRILSKGDFIYRLRRDPSDPIAPGEYDSAPDQFLGTARLDSPALPILYCSQDIEGCVHECRVTVEDELFLATLKPTQDLKLLDLTELLREKVTEFESLDLAVHMLFFAADHSYEISREIAIAAHRAGFDGLIYPSYFSQVRSGAMPLETIYGLSVRRFPGAMKHGIFENVGIFGRPVADGRIEVACVNRLMLRKVRYEIHFGPARPKHVYAEPGEDPLGDPPTLS